MHPGFRLVGHSQHPDQDLKCRCIMPLRLVRSPGNLVGFDLEPGRKGASGQAEGLCSHGAWRIEPGFKKSPECEYLRFRCRIRFEHLKCCVRFSAFNEEPGFLGEERSRMPGIIVPIELECRFRIREITSIDVAVDQKPPRSTEAAGARDPLTHPDPGSNQGTGTTKITERNQRVSFSELSPVDKLRGKPVRQAGHESDEIRPLSGLFLKSNPFPGPQGPAWIPHILRSFPKEPGESQLGCSSTLNQTDGRKL